MATGLDNLRIYQLTGDLEIEVHDLTKSFPKDEIFRSIDQLRRSSSSVSNNIAESYHKTTIKEKTRYLNIAKGEAEETKRGMLKSARKKFISENDAKGIADRYTIFLKSTNAYIRFIHENEQRKQMN